MLTPRLFKLGLLTEVDAPALAGLCAAWSDFRVTTAVLKKKGLTFKTRTGYIAQRPEVGIRNKALQIIRSFGSEFGLTPAARASIEISDANENAEDFFAAIN